MEDWSKVIEFFPGTVPCPKCNNIDWEDRKLDPDLSKRMVHIHYCNSCGYSEERFRIADEPNDTGYYEWIKLE